VNSPQRMRQRYAYGSNIAAVRCGWEDRIMSNGESKIAIFKAALCCGFAIALRALFLGILPPLPCGGGKGVGCHVEQSETSLCLESQKILLICHCERR
ncbi:MAG: hypothetical protein K2N69_01965, partial [Helicobacter sp.]|nr:hypothetical protein [Helicobacter sp.]